MFNRQYIVVKGEEKHLCLYLFYLHKETGRTYKNLRRPVSCGEELGRRQIDVRKENVPWASLYFLILGSYACIAWSDCKKLYEIGEKSSL